MYRVHFTYTPEEGNPYQDCLSYNDLEFAEKVVNRFKNNPRCSNVYIAHNAISNWCEAGVEIDRLRKLLSNAYVELQQIKKGYNEFISQSKATNVSNVQGNESSRQFWKISWLWLVRRMRKSQTENL